MKSSEVVPTNGSGHGALAGFLRERGVEVLICGGIGAGAQNALAEAGIKLYGGVSGSADSAVQALIEGNLSYNPDVMCDHHGEDHHGDHENCGGHGEGHDPAADIADIRYIKINKDITRGSFSLRY